MSTTLKYITVWLLLIGGVTIPVLLYIQHRTESRVQVLAGDSNGVMIERTASHYYLQGKLSNGAATKTALFMVDTGASTVLISGPIARDLGIKKGQSALFMTAAGETQGYFSEVDIELPGLGKMVNHRVAVIENADDVVLLGMDILKRYDLIQSDRTLTIKPRK
jgi:aspartyl protease family protein